MTLARRGARAMTSIASTSASAASIARARDGLRLNARLGRAVDALSRDEHRAFRAKAIALARQRVGMMTSYDAVTEEALRRAVRDAFGGERGVRVGRRVSRRFDALREALKRSSGGRVVNALETSGGELDAKQLDGRSASEVGATRGLEGGALASWDDDIEWGARLSKRKLRRVESPVDVERAGEKSSVEVKYDELDAAVYAVMRSPMTMGALKRILYETRDRLGTSFKPRSVLDFGSGPVPTTLFAVRAVFGDDVGTHGGRDTDVKVAFVDSNPGMMRFARRVTGYAKNIEQERRTTAALERASTTSEDKIGVSEELSDVLDDVDASVTRVLDFSDFEAVEDERHGFRPASALRLKTPHPWHESEGIRTSASLRGANRRGGFDVVVSSYALGEIPDNHVVNARGREVRNQRQLDVTIRQLWDKVAPGGILVLAEPGTPRGSLLIRRARAMLLDVARRDMEQDARRLDFEPSEDAVEAYVVAPCQHDKACPLKDVNAEDGFSTWCHFPQRTLRSAYVREMKHGARPYQDEKFSYVVLRKMRRSAARRDAARATQAARDALAAQKSATPNDERNGDEEDEEDEDEEYHESLARESFEDWSRVIRQPMKRKGHVVFELCAPSGELERVTVARSHGDLIGRDGYKYARKLRWGDLWPFTHKTVVKPGDQRAFELEASRFESDFLRSLRRDRAARLVASPAPLDPIARDEIEIELDDDDLDDELVDLWNSRAGAR